MTNPPDFETQYQKLIASRNDLRQMIEQYRSKTFFTAVAIFGAGILVAIASLTGLGLAVMAMITAAQLMCLPMLWKFENKENDCINKLERLDFDIHQIEEISDKIESGEINIDLTPISLFLPVELK